MSATICRHRALPCWALALFSATSLAQQGPASAPDALARPRFTVIELPPAAAGYPAIERQRPLHALRIATDAPRPLLRSLGLDATDCSLRFRMPSRIKQSRQSATGVKFEVAAQVGMGCSF